MIVFWGSLNAVAAAAASTDTLCSLIMEFIGRVFDGKDSILCLICWNTLSKVIWYTFSKASESFLESQVQVTSK